MKWPRGAKCDSSRDGRLHAIPLTIDNSADYASDGRDITFIMKLLLLELFISSWKLVLSSNTAASRQNVTSAKNLRVRQNVLQTCWLALGLRRRSENKRFYQNENFHNCRIARMKNVMIHPTCHGRRGSAYLRYLAVCHHHMKMFDISP